MATIFIECQGGDVTAVHSTDTNINVTVVNWDEVLVDMDARKAITLGDIVQTQIMQAGAKEVGVHSIPGFTDEDEYEDSGFGYEDDDDDDEDQGSSSV